MKIIQLIQRSQNRGAETFASQLSNHLINFGHDILMVSIFTGNSILPYSGEILCLNASPKNRFLDIGAWRKLSKIINDFKPDIVQANSGDTLKYAIFSKMLFRWKTPVVSRNASEIGRYLNSAGQKIFNNFIYSKVDYVISVSNSSKKDILNQFPNLKDRIIVIPVGLEQISKIKIIEWENKELKHIVHVGGFSFEKNHVGLLNIFTRVLKMSKNTHLHLIGDGPLKLEIEKLVIELNLEEKVSFYGFVENPLSYISAADVLVLPSIIEGLPGVLLEAMYVKTPVIAYDVGGISEIINCTTGTLIEKNDEYRFSQNIVRILTSPNSKQIAEAYKMVSNNYLNEQLALIFDKSYQKILSANVISLL